MKFYRNKRRGILCRLPPLVKNAKSKHQTKYDNSFSVLSGKLWNQLPRGVKHSKTMESFKSALTKFITQFPDHPPVPGIASDNSLLSLLTSGKYMMGSAVYGGPAASEEDYSSEEETLLMA